MQIFQQKNPQFLRFAPFLRLFIYLKDIAMILSPYLCHKHSIAQLFFVLIQIIIIIMESQEIKQLLQLIDKEAPMLVQKENIFDPPVKIYLTLKTIYQNFKKRHELQIMQARVFQISLKKNMQQKFTASKVTASSLFQFHHLTEQDIFALIQMKKYLKQTTKEDLYLQILKGIEKQDAVSQYMKCYRSILNQQFIANDMKTYSLIEQKMITKILAGKPLKGKDLKILAYNLLALPKIQLSILVLISKIYEKVDNSKQFEMFYLIFSQKFPQRPSQTAIQALVRISLPKTLEKMLHLYENNPQMRPAIIKAAYQEAKHKLSTMELTSTTKTIDILNFIVEVVKLGIPIWHQIIEWEHRAAQQPKNILKTRLQGILVAMLKDFRCFQTVISIIQKITDIDEHSQIGLIFVRQLLKLESRQYLEHRIVRKFLAIKILKYNSSEQYFKHIFSKNLRFVQIILEMFNYKNNSINFYNHILGNEISFQILAAYLLQLADKMPVKAKEFFIRCILADLEKCQLFANVNTPMMKLMGETISIQIATNLVRDLRLQFPTKGLIYMLSKLLTLFKEHKHYNILKNTTVRSLNIILIRTPTKKISRGFQINFPVFLKEYLIKQSNELFADVPQETKEQLKKTFQSYNRKLK